MNIRGTQTLTAIFTEPEPKLRKVNGSFLEDRDMAMCYRFYFYYHIIRQRLDDIPNIMEKEFYIGATTIFKRLTANDSLLKDINQNAPTRAQLRKRYPHLNWD
nr:hypothetical protein [Mucilaginibacter sp. L294]